MIDREQEGESISSEGSPGCPSQDSTQIEALVVQGESGDFPAAHSEHELPDIPDETTLHGLIVFRFLVGDVTALRIAKGLQRRDLLGKIAAYMRTQEFHHFVHKAQRDTAASVIAITKSRLHKYFNEMDGLAMSKRGDPRVKYQAVKDLLDRGGTASIQKLALGSPDDYKKAIEEFAEEAPADENDNESV